MGLRTNAEYLEKQKQHQKLLEREGFSGETERDTLPNTSYPLHGMSEAMYFKNARDFLRSTLAHSIINVNQDIFRRS